MNRNFCHHGALKQLAICTAMKRRLLLSLSLLTGTAQLTGAWAVEGTPSSAGGALKVGLHAKTVAMLRAQADSWDQAIVRKDRPAIEANLADDFRQIDGQGAIESKQSFVDDLMSAELELNPYTVEDLDVRLYGDSTALLSGRTSMTGKYQGKPFKTHYRYTDVYIRQGEAWKIVSIQISKIPGP